MSYPAKIQEFIEQYGENTPKTAFLESEGGDFYGFGYASPFEFVTAVNKYLEAVGDRFLLEDMFLPEDAKKRWGLSIDTAQPDEMYIIMDKVTDRTPHAFQLYHIAT